MNPVERVERVEKMMTMDCVMRKKDRVSEMLSAPIKEGQDGARIYRYQGEKGQVMDAGKIYSYPARAAENESEKVDEQ